MYTGSDIFVEIVD